MPPAASPWAAKVSSLTTVVTLVVTLFIPQPGDAPDIQHTWHISPSSIDECWDLAREFTATAEAGPLKLGGHVTATCKVVVPPTREH